jgi:hypothetical protein
MPSDLLDRMRRNPAGDWHMRDVEALCREHGLLFRAGKGTSTGMQNTRRRAKS